MTDTATPSVIDHNKAIELLRAEVAAAGPDTVYAFPEGGSGCFYSYNGAPSCLVGRALVRAEGWSIADLDKIEGYGGEQSAFELPEILPGLVTEEAASVFQAAQSIQDDRLRWGLALQDAEAEYQSILLAEYDTPYLPE